MKKKRNKGKLPDEIANHQWLENFDEKNPREQLEILRDRVVEIENNLGTSSVWLICLTMIVIALSFTALITGSIGFGGELMNNLTAMIKSKGH
jgi:uncharacterized protein YhaN